MAEREELKESIQKWREARHNAQWNWSAVHHACLFGAIVRSITAGTVLQIWTGNTTVATVLTSVAAVLTGLASSGGFERKWRSNRLSRGQGDVLLVELGGADADVGLVRQKYQDAIMQHDREVVGDKEEPAPPPAEQG